jgi:hypothetical protein
MQILLKTPANITYDPCKYYQRLMQILLMTPANIIQDPCKYYSTRTRCDHKELVDLCACHHYQVR